MARPLFPEIRLTPRRPARRFFGDPGAYSVLVVSNHVADPPPARVRPRLRGVLHEWAFYAAIPLGVVLGLAAETPRSRVAAAVFGGSVTAMFGASAVYHRVTWTSSRRRWMRRLDHAGIYGLIAGTYTPFGLLVLTGEWRVVVLAIVWSGTAVAVALKFLWTDAPKWLAAVIGIALGWVGVIVFPQLLAKTGPAASTLVLVGGLCYTLGALIYAWRRPDPFPRTFGYHELFHALVIVAVALQYAAVAFFLVPT
jgi:hemolysin III